MRTVLLLAWRYLAYHKVRSALLVLCVALVFVLPASVQMLVNTHAERLAARAASTPLIVGAKGSRYDLVLGALYFQGRVRDTLPMGELRALHRRGLGRGIPLHVRLRAGGHPLVGTTPEYFAFRGLRPARGKLPRLIGEAVLGAGVARALGLGPGDRLLSDTGRLYDVSLSYPLYLHVTGVLEPNGTADDGAVFTDLKTAWIVEGLMHGHQAAARAGPRSVLKQKPGEVVLNASVREYQEITPENLASFHMHGDPDTFPITAILVLPDDARAATLLKGYYRVSKTAQMLVPTEVVDEMLGFLFRAKAFFDANVALVTVAVALLLGLIVMLSVRVRRREIETLDKLGCARGTVLRILGTELALTIGAGLVLAALAAFLLVARLLSSHWFLA